MELKDVVSVAGKSGLHKIIGKGAAGLVLESIDDQAKRSITPVTQKVSILEDVSIYTEDSDLKLSQVFIKMEELDKAGTLIALSKDTSADRVKEWFAELVPNFSREKVYNSDIHKVAAWYNLLKGKVDFNAMPETEEGDSNEKEKSAAKSKAIKPIKKIESKAKTSKGVTKTSITSRKMS